MCKTKIMASGPITSWQIDGKTLETESDRLFVFLGSKITEDGNCNYKTKRRLLLERKAMTNPESTLKSKDSLWQQRPVYQSYGFSSHHVQMC